MIIHPTQPLLPKKMMAPRPMSHTPNQPVPMRTGRANSIEPTGTKTPNRHAAHVKLRPLRHVIQDTTPQPVRTCRVGRISRRVGRPGDLADDRCPAAVDDFMSPLAVIGPVPVQPGHEQDDRDGVGSARVLWDTEVQRDGLAIVAGGVRVRDGFFLDGWFPERGGFEVDGFLALEGEPF